MGRGKIWINGDCLDWDFSLDNQSRPREPMEAGAEYSAMDAQPSERQEKPVSIRNGDGSTGGADKNQQRKLACLNPTGKREGMAKNGLHANCNQ